MITQSILPPARLADYVSGIMTIEYSGGIADFNIPLFANGSPTILFQSAKSVNDNGGGYLNLYGQTVLPMALAFNQPVTLIAYFLHSHALKVLFGLHATELTNRCMDLHDLKQVREDNLQEQLLNADSLADRLKLIDELLINLSMNQSFDYAKLHFATTQLKNYHDQNVLVNLQQKLNTTERSLQRMFEANVGISPKMFKRVWQFNAAFQQLNQHRYVKLTDIAYQHGFADQSHFIRVFKEFTDLTPKEYLQKAEPYNPKF